MCIGSPAQDTPCRRSYDCHKGTVASVSYVLLREQKQGLSKHWRTLTLRGRHASHAFLERRWICLSPSGDKLFIPVVVGLHQNRTIIGCVSKQREVRKWIFLGNGGKQDLPRWRRSRRGKRRHGVSGLRPPPPQLLKVPIIRKNAFPYTEGGVPMKGK
jgi:hypothetical protein